MDKGEREKLDRRVMARQATEKVWHIPAYGGTGPVTMTLQVPDVTITDSDGRFIVISPRQSAIVSSRLECINEWLQHGDEEFPHEE
jgi:hypothetical protein